MPSHGSRNTRNKRAGYKHGLSLTSQLPFCSIPVRLDSYNKCQMGCEYCFASTRTGHGRDRPLQALSYQALDQRLSRVADGKIASALDEFLEQRIPIQLGGMADPFTPIESKIGNTRSILEVLRDHDYPYVVSTKSPLAANPEYLALLANSNCYVRLSTTVISEDLRAKIDRGCAPFDDICLAASKLAEHDIPVCFRFQPIIPGFERQSCQMLKKAASAKVKHISAEFLKVPNEANTKFGPNLRSLFNDDPIGRYKSLGAVRVGSEYSLPLSYRSRFLVKMSKQSKDLGMTFGFADNDLLIHSDGGSCCNGSDLYLRNANQFRANVVCLAKSKSPGQDLLFEELANEWMPSSLISPYLNSKSRLRKRSDTESEWKSYLSKYWLGELGNYPPNYFDGIGDSDRVSSDNMPIYTRELSSFERAINYPAVVR